MHRGAARQPERLWLARELHVLRLQRRGRGVETRRAEADVIDGAAVAWRRIAALDEQPDAAVAQAVEPILQLGRLPAKLLLVPGERGRGIRTTQVDVMEPELL